MTTRLGIRINTITVTKIMPNPSDKAIGIINLACLDVSKIIGANPPKVVRVVRMIGRKPRLPAL